MLYTLQQDHHEKIKVSATKMQFKQLLKTHFGWRKDITLKRLYGLGSKDFDGFVKFAKIRLT
jgi:hypothetical protein